VEKTKVRRLEYADDDLRELRLGRGRQKVNNRGVFPRDVKEAKVMWDLRLPHRWL
jgi:hypothetical protein